MGLQPPITQTAWTNCKMLAIHSRRQTQNSSKPQRRTMPAWLQSAAPLTEKSTLLKSQELSALHHRCRPKSLPNYITVALKLLHITTLLTQTFRPGRWRSERTKALALSELHAAGPASPARTESSSLLTRAFQTSSLETRIPTLKSLPALSALRPLRPQAPPWASLI